MKIKVLHIISSLEIGGAQRLLSDILPILNNHIEIGLLVYQRVDNDFARKIEQSGIPIMSLDITNIYNPIIILKLIYFLKHYDVAHVHLFPSLYWAAFASLFANIKLVYTEHNTFNKRRNRKYLRGIERWIYYRYANIISISELTQVALLNWIKPKVTKKFVTISNGINLKSFHHIKREKIYPFTLIMIARFAPAKDQATIIRAMSILTNDVHLILVGDGECRKDCEELSISLGLQSRVHFTGNQSNVKKWIGMADVGIQSSIWEGFGLTAVELMAAGLPVIASDVDGLRQVVEDAGLLFSVGNEQELAQHVEHLKNDVFFYHEVATRCSRKSVSFDINNMATEYENVYYKVLNCRT